MSFDVKAANADQCLELLAAYYGDGTVELSISPEGSYPGEWVLRIKAHGLDLVDHDHDLMVLLRREAWVVVNSEAGRG